MSNVAIDPGGTPTNRVELSDAELFEGFTTYQQARAFSPNTLRRRRLAFGRFAKFIAPSPVLSATPVDIDEWMSKLQSPRTRHAYRSDLKVFYRWAVRRGFIETNPVEQTDPVRVPRALPKPAPAEVIAEAFRCAPGDVQLAILLGALAGLRASEIASLDMADVHLDVELPVLIVRAGKGGKDRVVPIHPTLLPRLRGQSGWLFKSPHGGHVLGSTLARRVSEALSRAAGVTVTTHQLRHHFGTEAARWSGGNVVLVASLMGHSSTDTTMGYIGWAPTEAAEVVSKIVASGDDDELARRRQHHAS